MILRTGPLVVGAPHGSSAHRLDSIVPARASRYNPDLVAEAMSGGVLGIAGAGLTHELDGPVPDDYEFRPLLRAR